MVNKKVFTAYVVVFLFVVMSSVVSADKNYSIVIFSEDVNGPNAILWRTQSGNSVPGLPYTSTDGSKFTKGGNFDNTYMVINSVGYLMFSQ